jgi:uncharacterized protein
MIIAPSRSKKLLASIHDVSPKFSGEVVTLLEQLSRHLNGPNVAMLIVPDYWGSAPISQDRAFQKCLRGWADAGVEMFVHGWEHRDTSTHQGAMAGLKARHMTAGEGEFLGLDYDSALRRMVDGKKLIEDIIGRAATGFIAPAWLYGKGALTALDAAGFTMAEDHMKVWSPLTHKTLAHGPVITWASRSPIRIASSLGFAALARHVLQPMTHVRLAVHPGDAHVPSIRNSIEKTMTKLLKSRSVGRYNDLM